MINPILVSAPLRITDVQTTDIENIYIFDYSKSFIGRENRPKLLLNYIESLGCMCDILVDGVGYNDKEQLILEYFNSKTFCNVYTLSSTMISILFHIKDIPYFGTTILKQDEVVKFISDNKEFINEMVDIYDSLFMIMLLYSLNPTNDMNNIKMKYSNDRIVKKEYSPNICNLLLNKEFYDYYDKHVSSDVKYYEFLFDKTLYRGKGFLSILTTPENKLLNILTDLLNPKFKEYVLEKGS